MRMLQRLFQGLSGARRGEQLPVLLSFLALYFLLFSYYLVKPLREARLFMHFSADILPYFLLATPFLALAVTKFFNFWVGRIPRYHLMLYTYAIMMVCKLLFLVALPLSGRLATVFFFFWASVYFTLVLSILWGVITTIFKSDQAERFFGFVALGATLGNITGAKISSWLAEAQGIKDWALLFAAVAMGLALGLIMLAVHFCETQTPQTQKKNQKVSRGWQDLVQMVQSRYVRGIAMMVFSLALMGTVINLQVFQQIDGSLAEKVYAEVFVELDAEADSFQLVYGLKKLNAAEQTQSIQALAQAKQWSAESQAQFQEHYALYRETLEGRTRKLFADVYFWQGILGVFLLVVVARILFRYVGLRWTVLILPGFFFAAGLALMFPLEVLWLQLMLIMGGSLNYSLNNATKELLYTPTSESVRFQLKPLIEGPVMRIGDVSASLAKIALTSGLAAVLVLSEGFQDRFLLSFGLVVVALWGLLIWRTGSLYDQAQKIGDREQELD